MARTRTATKFNLLKPTTGRATVARWVKLRIWRLCRESMPCWRTVLILLTSLERWHRNATILVIVWLYYVGNSAHCDLCVDSLSMSDLFSGFSSNGNNGNQMVSQQDDVLANLLQQHQLSQALKQHQLEQQREQQNQLKSFSTSSLFLNKVCFLLWIWFKY